MQHIDTDVCVFFLHFFLSFLFVLFFSLFVIIPS